MTHLHCCSVQAEIPYDWALNPDFIVDILQLYSLQYSIIQQSEGE